MKGSYFAWGEKKEKRKYTWDNYSYPSTSDINYGYSNRVSDGYIFGEETLLRNDKLYTVGIPTYTEFKELVDNCTMKEQTIGGTKGILFTSKKNSVTLFLPYTGSYYDDSTPTDGTATYYWTSTKVDSKKAYAAMLKDGKVTYSQCQKRTGMPMRAIARYERAYDPSEDDWWSNSGNFAVDGINNIKSQIPNDGAIYTLQGVKVEGKPQPGIYVRNGRKFVVK